MEGRDSVTGHYHLFVQRKGFSMLSREGETAFVTRELAVVDAEHRGLEKGAYWVVACSMNADGVFECGRGARAVFRA